MRSLWEPRESLLYLQEIGLIDRSFQLLLDMPVRRLLSPLRRFEATLKLFRERLNRPLSNSLCRELSKESMREGLVQSPWSPPPLVPQSRVATLAPPQPSSS
jgi:hypothetical protein